MERDGWVRVVVGGARRGVCRSCGEGVESGSGTSGRWRGAGCACRAMRTVGRDGAHGYTWKEGAMTGRSGTG